MAAGSEKHPSQFIICVYIITLLLLKTTTSDKVDANPQKLGVLCDPNASNLVQKVGCRLPPVNATETKEKVNMFAVRCVLDCWDSEFNYAWAMGTQCTCTQEDGAPADQAQCSKACPGAKKEICGGETAASVFKTGYVHLNQQEVNKLYSAARVKYFEGTDKKTANMKRHDGYCVKMAPQETVQFTSRLLTRKLCVIHCYHYRHVYALMSAGKNCVCTSWMPDGNAHFAKGLCSTPCNGDKTEMCGGNKHDIFQVLLTGHFAWNERLSQNYFLFLPALWQQWSEFLYAREDVWTELLKMGIDLIPGQKPKGWDAVKIAEENESDVDVQDDVGGDDGMGMVVGMAVGGVILLSIIIVTVVFCARRSKTKTEVKSSRSKKLTSRSSLLD